VTKREVGDEVQLVSRASRINDEEWKAMLASIKQMEARGPLPLFRNDADAKLEQFRKTHDLKRTFPLKRKLHEICAEKVQLGLSRSPKGARTTTRARKFLSRANRLATELTQLLGKARRVELEAILPSSGKQRYTYLPELHDHLVHLAIRASQLKAAMRTGAGRRADPFLQHLLSRLHEIFHEGSDRKRTLCSRTVQGEYAGDFFLFVRDMLPMFGIENSDVAIGRRIERAFGKAPKPRKSNTGIGKVRNKSGV
jgi:hypothetical protein